ncbi:MAG TPA: protein kinase, partial [Gemmatimonadaceae bacterium]|nr:protein kinase [Gemmatimonadaceae bacterium]
MRIKLKQQRLAEIIATSGLTQNHWAIRLGLSRGHWSDIVNGNHPYPSAKTRTRILDAFAVPFEVLFEIEVTADPWVDTDFRRAISDRYIIDNEIGQGGMGAVYLARDIRHGRAVAVKVIAPEAVSGIGMTQFQREVSTVAQLQHPNILPMFEAGDIAGHPFFVMPLVRGGSLRDRLKQETRLSLSDAVALVRGIAEALQFAHGERVLHCDVKPENILLHKRHPWVTDFGIARRLHNEPRELARRQGLDISAGTPAYVSPEQAAGETDLDARSDVYSLGCMVYEMLSGRPPFEGTSTQQVVASRFIAPAPPLRDFAPDVSPDVQAVIQRAMALPREQRPHTATAFADELERAAARKPHLLANASYATWRHINRVQRRLDVLPRHPIGGLVRNFIEDIHYAARLTARNVVVSAAVVATMVLGIAVTTAVFSVVNSVLLKPLPFDGSDRVVRLGITGRSGTFSQLLAYPDIQDYKRNAHMFADITAVLLSGVTLGGGGVPEQLLGAYVDEAYARVFSVQPVAGRFFAADEFSEGSPRVVMISHGLWQRQFGSDTSIVGRTITLDNEPTTVVGVLPPMAYTFPYPGLRFLAPLRPRAGTYQVNRGAQWLRAAGRMRPGVTVEQARADVAGIAAGIAKQFPDANIGLRTRVELLHDVEGEDVRPMLVLLSLAVAAVLIIACVNIANVLLGQSRARAREFAVRAALGGSGGRIQRQLITESMFLATIGGALGIALAPRLTHLLVALYPGRLPRAEEVG